jgi:uncharacterized protein (DUF885 family)
MDFSAQKNDLKLWEIFGRYHEYTMQTYPEWATFDGDNRFDDKVTDQADSAHRNNFQSIKKFHNDLINLDYNALSEDNQVNFDLFKTELEINLLAENFNMHYLPINQLNGIHIDLLQLIDVQPLNNIEEYRKYLKRLSASVKQIDNIIENMRTGINSGLVLPGFIIGQIITQIDELRNADSRETPFYIPLLSDKNLMGNEKAIIEKELLEIIDKEIKPGYTKLADFLNNEYLQNGRKDAGIWSIPNGDKYYEHEIRHFTSTDLKAEEIHQIGLAEVQRIRSEMEKVKDEIGFQGSLDEFNQFLKTDMQFYYTNKEDLLNGYREILKKIDEKVAPLFNHFPRATCEVKEIDEYMAKSAPMAFYHSAPDDRSRPAYFYANTYDLVSRPKYAMTALTLHEAVPGHHLQIALAQEIDNLPWFRKLLDETAFVEGWALYAESLGYDLQMYEDKYQHYGALTYEIERACRLVVDTGMHYKKWTREQAYQFLRKNTPSSDHDVISEIDRYIVWPGQALAYKIGELKIKELRKLAETELGKKFDIKEFHHNVLCHGAIPLSLLEKKIREWINNLKENLQD